MAPVKPRKDSQFAAATAMLGKKDNMNLELKTPSKNTSKTSWTAKNGSKSVGNIEFSPSDIVSGVSTGGVSKDSKFAPPPFVSPGPGLPKSKFVMSSYLDKPSGTPSHLSKPKVPSSPAGFGGLVFSPSPASGGKPKVNTQSWKEKPSALSFQAQSPLAVSKPKLPTSTYYGGSYLNKGNNNNNAKFSSSEPSDDFADVKIEVKIDIQAKLKARQRSAKPLASQQPTVPEHIRRAREREERRMRAAEEEEYRAASLVQAAFLGWFARVQYPKLLAANADRLAESRRREAAMQQRDKAILIIQSSFRMYGPRKRFLYVRDCKRRREQNLKEMKKIEKTIKSMPKKTKTDIKEMKKEYNEKKKAFKENIAQQLKEEDEKLAEIKKSGQDMIKYWENQNEKVKNQKTTIKTDQKVLEQQFEVLTAKSEEIHKNFLSLQAWVEKKNIAISKHEAADQKCRHKYLPTYRADIAERNKFCIAECRIKELYRKELKKIIKEVEKNSKDPILVKYVKKEMKACQKEIASMPQVPVPEGLERWLK